MAECNDYEGLRINPTPSSIGNQYAGVSTDEKPTGVPTYSVYLELDTGKFYYYNGTEWEEIPCCGGEGGGGGSSDLSIAQVTIAVSGNIVSATYYMPTYISNDEFSASLYDGDISRDSSPSTVPCILYKGAAIFFANGPYTLTGSGNVEIDGVEATITGDCTITIGPILGD